MRRLAVVSALVVAACVPAPRALPTPPQPAAAPTPPAVVCDDLYDSPAIDPIREKVPVRLGSSPVTLRMLADDTKPTADEKRAILAWDDARVQCSERRDKVKPPPPGAQSARAKVAAMVAELYTGRQTFAQFAQTVQDVTAAAEQAAARDREIQAEKDERDRQMVLEHQRQVMQQRQQQQQNILRGLAAGLRDAAHTPTPAPYTQPTRCTTRQVGSQLVTECERN